MRDQLLMGLSEDICDRMRFDRRARSWTLMDPLGEWTDLRDLKDSVALALSSGN